MEHNVHSEIWDSSWYYSRLMDLKGDSYDNIRIFSIPAVSRDIVSPMFCVAGSKTLYNEKEIHPTLDIKDVIEIRPEIEVIKSGFVKKKRDVIHAYSKRFLILTSDKLLYWYEHCFKYKVVDLEANLHSIHLLKNDKFEIKTNDNESYEFDCSNSSQIDYSADFGLKTSNNLNHCNQNSAFEWVECINKLTNPNIQIDESKRPENDGNDMKMKRSLSVRTAHSAVYEKSEYEWIEYLLCQTIKKYDKLLQTIKKEGSNVGPEHETNVCNKVKCYEDLANTMKAFEILLHYSINNQNNDETIPLHKKSCVKDASKRLRGLIAETREIILQDIMAYSGKSLSTQNCNIIRLNRACCIMEELGRGKSMVCEYVAGELLKKTDNFQAGKPFASLQHFDRRVKEYNRIMKDEYNQRFDVFIPKWWNLGIQIASKYVALMSYVHSYSWYFPLHSDFGLKF